MAEREMLQVAMAGTGGTDVLRVVEGEIPVPAQHEVLVEVHAAGVNRPDIAQREGRYPPPPGASPILGLEVAGLVASAPAGSPFKAGDPVCALVPGGGYAGYCVTPAAHCLPVPRGFSFEEAAGIPETFFTVWANVFQLGRLARGERFLVHGGASGIGTTAIQLARAFGAEVYATAGNDKKCADCVALGATAAINYKASSFHDEIARLTNGQGVNLILDMVGGGYTEKNLACLGYGGRLVQIAAQQGATVSVNLFTIMQKRLTITGSTMRPRSIEDKAAIASELARHVWPLLETGQVKVVVDKVFSFRDVAAAHAYLESGAHTGKVILKFR